MKILAIPAIRSNFFDVGWFNILASSIITVFTVAAGFYEMMLANPITDVKSAWGMDAMSTMLWHGVGGVFLLAFMVGMAIWRGFQRFIWRKERTIQVQWSYLGVGMFMLFLLFLHVFVGFPSSRASRASSASSAYLSIMRHFCVAPVEVHSPHLSLLRTGGFSRWFNSS